MFSIPIGQKAVLDLSGARIANSNVLKIRMRYCFRSNSSQKDLYSPHKGFCEEMFVGH